MAPKVIQKSMKHLAILLLLLGSAASYAKDSPFAGSWQLNLEESDKVSESYEEGSGAGRAKIFQNINMTVMGLPLPRSTRTPSQSRMPPKNPSVLLCNQMDIEIDNKRVNLVYDSNDKESLRRGHYRGRNSTWSKKKIKQDYKTPEREVTKTWRIRKDGRLLVEVKINPPKDRSRTFRRVFDRVATPP